MVGKSGWPKSAREPTLSRIPDLQRSDQGGRAGEQAGCRRAGRGDRAVVLALLLAAEQAWAGVSSLAARARVRGGARFGCRVAVVRGGAKGAGRMTAEDGTKREHGTRDCECTWCA